MLIMRLPCLLTYFFKFVLDMDLCASCTSDSISSRILSATQIISLHKSPPFKVQSQKIWIQTTHNIYYSYDILTHVENNKCSFINLLVWKSASMLVELNWTLGQLIILGNQISLSGVDRPRHSTTQSYNNTVHHYNITHQKEIHFNQYK